MNNNKLFSILHTFNKYEQNRLRKFILSPYFNKSERLIALFELLCQQLTSNQLPKKEIIWKKIGYTTTFNDTKLRKDFSDLLKLIERFLAMQVYESDKFHEVNFLIQALQNSNLEKLQSGVLKTSQLLIERYPIQSAQRHLNLYNYEKNLFLLEENTNQSKEKNNVEAISQQLDLFFIAEKLRYHCYALASKHIANHEYQIDFIAPILEYIETHRLEQYPAIQIYYKYYLTLSDHENETHYYQLKKLLETHALDFPKMEAFDLYLSTLNYCIRKINSGSKKFLEEYFEINNDFLQKGIIFLEDHLDPIDFNNIVISALRLKKYDWAENFIHEYKNKILPSHRDNAVTFNLARLHLYQKNYDEAIRLLSEVEYENLGYNLKSKTMLIATYYEINAISPLQSLLESFRAFLHRHKEIANNRRRSYLNLIKFTKKIIKIIPKDTTTIEKVRQEIEETRNLVNKEWLKEKLSELQ